MLKYFRNWLKQFTFASNSKLFSIAMKQNLITNNFFMRSVYRILFLFISLFAFVTQMNAQCYSDFCIDSPANTTAVPGCCTATTVGMTTSVASNVSGCANFAGGQDVWLTFMAPANGYLQIDFTAITIGGTVNMIVFDSFSNADNCSTLNAGGYIASCESFLASANPTLNLNYVQAGERYFILVSTPPGSTPGSFEVCLSITLPIGGMDCTGATALCDKSTQTVADITAGGGAISGDNSVEDLSTDPGGPDQGLTGSCWGNGPGDGGGEVNSQWYLFTASTTGTLTMAVFPNNTTVNCAGPTVTGDDYDYMLLDITKAATPYFTCNIQYDGIADSATVVKCNWSAQPGVTGFGAASPNILGYYGTSALSGQGGCQATDGFNGTSSLAWSTTDATVTCGRTYALVLSNYTGASTQGFTLKWGGTSTFGVQPVTMTAPVLGSYCDVTATITAPLCSGSLISSYRYLVDWGDGSTQYATSTNLAHSYGDDGTYNITLTVTDPVGCTQGFAQTLSIVCSPLPVGTKNLSVENMGYYNQFKWETFTETNNDYFVIERSQDLAEWHVVGQIDGYGNSNETIKYKFDDDSFSNVANYYRLKQVDYDGLYQYHGPVFIDNSLENQEVVSVRIYDFMGKELETAPAEGSYILHITYKNGQTVVKKIAR